MRRAEAAHAAAVSSKTSPEDGSAVRDELRRISTSPTFRGSKRSQEFLDHTVCLTLDNRPSELKERLIGSALFGRSPDYDTGTDSIVRVVANETRRRLQQFYHQDVQPSPMRINLPPGSYVPQFHRLELPVEVLPAPPVEVPVRNWTVPILSVALAVLLILSVALAVQNRSLRHQTAPAKNRTADVLPWSSVLRDNRGIHIVLADTSIGGVQTMLHSKLSLSDYLNRKFIPETGDLPPERLGFYNYLLSNQFTSASYAITGIRIAQLAQSFEAPVTVSYARELSLRTFKGGENFVVLGTARANPWAQLFEDQLNFVLDFEDASREPWFRNRNPKSGESAVYTASDQSPTLRASYGHIAFLPSVYKGGDVLFVTGTNSQATEAAGEFVTDITRLRKEMAAAGLSPAAPRAFEILLRVHQTAGVPVRSEVVAWR